MKRISALAIFTLVMLTASILMSQVGGSGIVLPPNPVADTPYDPSTPTGILPVEFKAAYGFNRIPNQGEGQTIALIGGGDDPNLESDLAFYASYFHLGPCNFQKVKIGNPAENMGWGIEESLDVEQACALVPQANIILVEANTSLTMDLLAAMQVATSAPYNATVIPITWGLPEFQGELSLDSYFCNIVNGNGQPVTFVAASGDGRHGTIWPSASSCVIAVGGTVLTLSTATPLPDPLQLNYGSETAWFGSGGGVSQYETQMSFQNPACSMWSNTNRCVPDVASAATNIPTYDTYGYGGWVPTDGTSISSPDWAAFFVIVNSLRAAAGKGTLSQAAQDLYTIYYSSNYDADFHDITTGTNGDCGSQCDAGPGYDLVTGIGTYQANTLAQALVADPN